MYLFDTDHIGILQRTAGLEFETLARRIASRPPKEFFTSIISFHEQVSGWSSYLNRARTPQDIVLAYYRFEKILKDFSQTQVLPFDDAASDVFDSLKEQRIRVGTQDLRIASVAIANQMTLLTRNLRDFKKVPGLDVEDWTRAE